jgi:hypothetical protein
VLAWLYWRRPAAFGRLRSALVLATTAANVVFWAWPVAPPRLAVRGMTDILATRDILGAADPHGATSLVNLYAAMPSLHVAWAVWCATAIVITTRSRWRHLAWLYPAAATGRPGTGSRSRAATAGTLNPAARSASAAKITGAAYLRRDSKNPGSSTCERPQARQSARRGRTTASPANVATRRGRACPHGRSVPPHQQARSPDRSRASTDSSEPRTVTIVVPPAPLGRPSRYPGQRFRGAVAYADMATVAPSTSTRPSHSPTHTATTPSVTATSPYMDVLRGGGHPRTPRSPARRSPGRRSRRRREPAFLDLRGVDIADWLVPGR